MGFDEEKNYHIVDELAYTEDNILVHNIFVYQIPKKTTEAEVCKYFSKFGKAKCLRLVPSNKQRKNSPKIAFVHYVDAAHAAKALQQTHPHILNSKRVHVVACDTWRQPSACIQNTSKNCIDNERSIAELGIKNEETTLAMLNDDCLEHIVRKLGIRDQVRFSLTCQRFKSIFEMVCKTEYKIHPMEQLEGLTLWEIREFFLVAGPHIESLMGSVSYKYRDRIVEFIGKYCINIKQIDFDSSIFRCSTLVKLFNKLTNCSRLELRDCSLNDHAILALKKLPNLEFLSVAENFELTGKNIDHLSTVKDLVLYGCGNIQSSHFIDIIKSLKDLISLDIQRCERLSTDALGLMVQHCHKLEALKFSSRVIPNENVALLPNLKKLEFLSLKQLSPHVLFQKLAQHKADQLESLKIVSRNWINTDNVSQIARIRSLKQLICANNIGLTDECLNKLKELKNLEEIVLKNCSGISNQGLLDLIKNCSKLRKVNIQQCYRIKDKFVLDAIPILESTKSDRGNHPCVFFVARSGIGTYMTNHAEYKAAANNGLIKLIFFSTMSMFEGDDVFDELDMDDDDFDDSTLDDDYDYDDPYDMFNAFADDYDDYDEDSINEAFVMFGGYNNFEYRHDYDFMW